MYTGNKDHHSCPDDKRSLSTSIDSEDTPTDTEQSPDSSDDSRKLRKKSGDSSSSNIKFGFESLHTYEKRLSSSLPPQLGGTDQAQPSQSRNSLRGDGFASLPEENSRVSASGVIGGSRSLKARLAERARTLEAERRRMAEEQQQQQQQQLQEMNVSVTAAAAAAAAAASSAMDEDPADEDRFYKKARKLPRFSLFARTSSRDSPGSNRDALQSSSSGVSDIAEEKEDEFSGWRSSFESAIAADSRTKLSLEAKRFVSLSVSLRY